MPLAIAARTNNGRLNSTRPSPRRLPKRKQAKQTKRRMQQEGRSTPPIEGQLPICSPMAGAVACTALAHGGYRWARTAAARERTPGGRGDQAWRTRATAKRGFTHSHLRVSARAAPTSAGGQRAKQPRAPVRAAPANHHEHEKDAPEGGEVEGEGEEGEGVRRRRRHAHALGPCRAPPAAASRAP